MKGRGCGVLALREVEVIYEEVEHFLVLRAVCESCGSRMTASEYDKMTEWQYDGTGV